VIDVQAVFVKIAKISYFIDEFKEIHRVRLPSNSSAIMTLEVIKIGAYLLRRMYQVCLCENHTVS
jgi:hypothetical protein